MATAMKTCRVCGKEYECCHTLKRVAGVFRWQDVACSPECGEIYLARIRASRQEPTSISEVPQEPKQTEPVEEYIDDEEFDEEWADEEDEDLDDEVIE